jgi:hypothetical protein
MNKRGSCPEQTLAHIKAVKKKLGHVPSKREFIKEMGTQRWFHFALWHFGSWNEALRHLGYKPIDAPMRYQKEYSRTALIGFLKAYYKKYKKVPTRSDFRRGLLPSRGTYWKYFGGLTLAHKAAGIPYKFWRLKDEKVQYPLVKM